MARPIHKLRARTLATLTTPGRHSDGGGLYLSVSRSGARSWVFLWKAAGQRHEMGLGSLLGVSLAKARQRAADARRKLADGVDPLATREPWRRRAAARSAPGTPETPPPPPSPG
jgi:hypothetical protein